MARSAILSNGRLCVGLDEKGFVNDFYYPHVGLHNMTSARSVHHKIGIWVDGIFSWLDDPEWKHSVELNENTMMARSHYTNEKLELSLSFRDFVDTTIDFFGRVVIVENRADKQRIVRLYFGQVFQISRAGRADTALYVPSDHPYILTYNGNISFAASLRTQDGVSFDQFAVGNYGIEGKSGTYKDAEDGQLSGNLVEHGGVDSIIQASFSIHAKGAFHVDYWIAASERGYNAASAIHRTLAKNGLYHYLNSTNLHWMHWLAKSSDFLNSLDDKYRPLAKKSLLVIKAHCDMHGGILASADSSIYNYGRDYYSYVWPRDAFYALSPLLELGYTEETKNYLAFVSRLLHKRGYVHHKYSPDGSMGSSWHPLVQDGNPELNIQEDETAATLLLAVRYIELTGTDTPEAIKLFETLIKPCANFMAKYIDKDTGLPHASYDLWEQVFITSTYTTSIVYKALNEATRISNILVPNTDTSLWLQSIASIEQNYSKLFNEQSQWFVRGTRNAAHKFEQVSTLDISSLYGMSTYGPSKPDDTAVYATQMAVEAHLQNSNSAKGVIRYPGDDYMASGPHYTANPWYVCTLWLGKHYANIGNHQKVIEALDWTLHHASNTGMLSEQLDPESGAIKGVTPLVWSHAEYLSLLIAKSKMQ